MPQDGDAGTPAPGPAPWPPEAVHSTGFLLARAGAQARRAFTRMLAEHDLTAHHFGVLMTLARLGPTSQQRISQTMGIDPRNTTSLIDALHGSGLLDRRPDPADRRRHVLSLTPAGEQTVGQLVGAADQLEHALLGPLSAAQREQLRSLLVTLLPEVTS